MHSAKSVLKVRCSINGSFYYHDQPKIGWGFVSAKQSGQRMESPFFPKENISVQSQ